MAFIEADHRSWRDPPLVTASGELGRIAAYYDRWSPLFLEAFGTVFQAGLVERLSPAASVVHLTSHLAFTPGDHVLDAGCGIGGPAISLAEAHPEIEIEAVTISPVQAAIATSLVAEAGLTARIRILVGDYHELPHDRDVFDHVVLFETIGYSYDIDRLFDELWRVLKPGGTVFIKDVFRQAEPLTGDQLEAMQEFDELWGCVRSPRLAAIAGAAKSAGFAHIEAVPLDLSTERLLGAMFQFTKSGVVHSPLGEQFYRPNLNPPITFGTLTAVKPS